MMDRAVNGSMEELNLGIILFDIDHFKYINDIFGHGYGDECLRKIGKEMNIIAAKHHCEFCRYGGEEFVGVFIDPTKEYLMEMAELIRKNLMALKLNVTMKKVKPIFKESSFNENKVKENKFKEDYLTVSLGVAMSKSIYNEKELQNLIKKADQALYFSKNNGRNITTFYSEEEYKISN